MNGQEAGSTTVTAAGVGLTQAPFNWLQVVGLLLAVLGLVWNVYAVITRNQHNRFIREQREESDRNKTP
ncbi:hypothetical protein ACJJH9_00205 (plasmid) [Microbulbifer sp. DLAB2-AF]|uniref:hypothetical protein n=1 Tax=Microbulbifer sp. DLAB2-AF TaxID=3243395 RepID=UPI0040398F0A